MTSKTKLDKVIVVTHYFISKNKVANKGLSNRKLQKLLYYAQAWGLVLNNKRLFNHKFEAWVHGAAIPVIHQRYHDFGFHDIVEEYDESEFDLFTNEERKLLDEVWHVYGRHDAIYLELLNNNEEPWQNARHDLPLCMPATTEISEKDMKRYYGDKLKKINAESGKKNPTKARQTARKLS